MQLDQGERGFSFMRDGPLDMRMDPHSLLTAGQIINRWSEKKLGELFRDFGEEPRWRRAAKAIVERRRKEPFKTTQQLALFISSLFGRGSKKRLHPATLIFQALRICVNGELESLATGVAKAIAHLAPGGRLGVMSFHRLEDRIVKDLFRMAARSDEEIRITTKKPLTPTLAEMIENPRARSAKMRFLERLNPHE
jgi:16S rRNA (cytosine1402-N4)-methyltransferase